VRVIAGDRRGLREIEGLAFGEPSTMSTRTTSASPDCTINWAVAALTLPAPTIDLKRIGPASRS
jgi:hypothetical protein